MAAAQPGSHWAKWTQVTTIGRWQDSSDSEAIREASALFQQARDLDSQGRHTAEALRLCCDFLEKNLDRSPRGNDFEKESFVMRCTLMQILELLCGMQISLERLGIPRSEVAIPQSCYTFLEERIISAVGVEPISIASVLLQTCRTILRFVLGYFTDKDFGRNLGIQLLEIVEMRREFRDCDESRQLVKYLAESFVYDSPHKFLKPRSLHPKANVLIRNHLTNLSASEDQYDKDALSYFYAIGRVFMLLGEEEGPGLIRQAFNRRTVCYGEDHTESENFIDDLLQTFCERCKGRIPSWSRIDHSHTIIKDLIEFCLDEEGYEETEILIQECVRTVKLQSTSANSATSEFPLSQYNMWHGTQRELARYKTPSTVFFWEDSRMYLRQWRDLVLIPAFPPDPFPHSPVKFIIEGNDFRVVASQTALRDLRETYGADVAVTPLLQETALWKYAEFLRSEGKLESLIPSTSADPPSSGDSKSCTLLIFPEDQLAADSIDDVTASSPDTRVKLRLDTRKLHKSESEFMVLAPPAAGSYKHPPASHFKLDELRYSIDEIDRRYIRMTLPFVPYEYFQRTRAWRYGLTYVKYLKVLRHIFNSEWGDLSAVTHVRERACMGINPKERMRLWSPSRQNEAGKEANASQKSLPNGFFNGIPSGPLLVDSQNILDGFNLVSSSWSDWTRFIVHEAAPEQTPKLLFSDQIPVPCHGYIMGRWSAGDLSQQWNAVKFFVVDAEFGLDEDDKHHNFLLNPNALTDMNVQSLSSLEKLVFCGGLNPRMFRLNAVNSGTAGASYWKRSRTKKQDAVTHEPFWEEMNRREIWDRTYEKRVKPFLNNKYPSQEDEEIFTELRVEKKEEDERRRDWDAKQMLKSTKA